MKEREKLPKTKKVLLTIADVGRDLFDTVTALSFYRSALARGGIEYVRVIRRLEKERYEKKVLYELKRRKYIEKRSRGNKLYIMLTEKGMNEIIRLRCRDAQHCRRGEFILVLFDIPETERRARLQLRRFLKECGFTMLQRSVWQCPKEVLPIFRSFVRLLDVEKWVTVLRASEQ